MNEEELVCPVCQSVPVVYEAGTGELECPKCKERFTKDAFLQRTFDVQKSVGLQNLRATVEPLYRRILPIVEKVYGSEHPQMVASLNALAELLRGKGDYAGAEPLYRRALAIQEKNLSDSEHTDIAYTLNKLADLLHSQGRHEDAEKSHCRAAEFIKSIRPT